MSTGNSWEGIRQVRATLLGARHVPERLCGGRVYLGRYISVRPLPFFTFFTVFSAAKMAHTAYSIVVCDMSVRGILKISPTLNTVR